MSYSPPPSTKGSKNPLARDRPLLVIIPDLDAGGAQRVALLLSEALSTIQDRPVRLVLFRAKGPFLDTVPNTVEVVNLGASRVRYALPALASYLRNQNPLTTLSMIKSTNVICSLAHRLAGRPGRLIIREANVRNNYNLGTTLVRRVIWRLLMSFTYRHADALVVNASETPKSLTELRITCPSDINVIDNPISAPPITKYASSSDYRPWENGVYLCSIGRLVDQKGFDILIRALALQKHKLHSLVILGEGPKRAHLTKLAHRLGVANRVFLPGYYPPHEVLKNAAGFVSSSRNEGSPNAIGDALAAGCPIVATDCPGATRHLLKGGRHGLLVSPEDATALSKALDHLLTETLPSGKIQQARAEEFSPETIARFYLSVMLGTPRTRVDQAS